MVAADIWNGYTNIRQHTHHDPDIKRDKEGHFMKTRESIYQEGIVIDMNVPDKRKKDCLVLPAQRP